MQSNKQTHTLHTGIVPGSNGLFFGVLIFLYSPIWDDYCHSPLLLLERFEFTWQRSQGSQESTHLRGGKVGTPMIPLLRLCQGHGAVDGGIEGSAYFRTEELITTYTLW